MAAPCVRRLSAVFVFLLICVSWIDCRSTVIQLDDDSWRQILDGEWMVEFYAPWCPACKGLQKIWDDFSSWSADLGIKVAQVDVTSNQGLSGRFMVTALPTIYHVKDGHFRQYRGSRDKEAFITFIEEKKWVTLEEVSWFWRPSSIQMSIVSYFYKLSMVLRSVHNQLVEVYGFPNWASLILFGLGTILIGAILGLLLVCVADVVFPPMPREAPRPTLPPKLAEPLNSLPKPVEDSSAVAGSKSPKLNKTKAGSDENVSQDSPPTRQVRKRKPVAKEEL